MKTVFIAIAISLFAMGSAAYACGAKKMSCADGYTYSSTAGGCVKVTVDS
ncbi:MAG: hypothetical protein AAF557_10345 [Pseudomonadota bacterium]